MTMRRAILGLVLIIGISCGGVMIPVETNAQGYNPFDIACDDPAAKESETCKSGQDTNQNPLTGTQGTITRVANIIAIIAGFAAIIMLIIAGMKYITAGGDAQQAATAKRTIIGALVGIAIIVFARTMVFVVLNSLE